MHAGAPVFNSSEYTHTVKWIGVEILIAYTRDNNGTIKAGGTSTSDPTIRMWVKR